MIAHKYIDYPYFNESKKSPSLEVANTPKRQALYYVKFVLLTFYNLQSTFV